MSYTTKYRLIHSSGDDPPCFILKKPKELKPVFMGAEVEKKKAIEKGKDELKKNEDLLKPRDMKPWEDITDMKIIEGKAKIAPKPPALEERHAQEYDDLLSGLPQKDIENKTKKVAKTEMKKTDSVKTSSITDTDDKGKKPGDIKEENPKLVIKRDWAKKAEDEGPQAKSKGPNTNNN